VRFKKVALWSFKSAREEFYRALEKTFADYFNVPFSGKNDRWQSFGVLEAEFKAVKEGEGKNKHDCYKTVVYTKPRSRGVRGAQSKPCLSSIWALLHQRR